MAAGGVTVYGKDPDDVFRKLDDVRRRVRGDQRA